MQSYVKGHSSPSGAGRRTVISAGARKLVEAVRRNSLADIHERYRRNADGCRQGPLPFLGLGFPDLDAMGFQDILVLRQHGVLDAQRFGLRLGQRQVGVNLAVSFGLAGVPLHFGDGNLLLLFRFDRLQFSARMLKLERFSQGGRTASPSLSMPMRPKGNSGSVA